jgi:hypothetical protein
VAEREGRVTAAVKMIPAIRDGRVMQLVLEFTPPIDLESFESLAKKIGGAESAPHTHFFERVPLYTFGEMTAVVIRCECGLTMRERV